jgi:hypothetical protein
MSISVGEKLICDPRTLENFNNLLSCAKERLQRDSSRFASGDFWKIFEGEVCKALDKSKDFVGVPDWNIEYIGGHKFPDIVARINKNQALGIEVKTLSTRNDSWKVMGGSIMESTRIPDVSRIHVFCGKQNPFEIKYRSFEDCVEDVAVTHSPRYMLDMDVSNNQSLFKRLGKTYDEIRHMKNPFDAFKEFIVEQRKINLKKRKLEDDFWWYSPNSNQIDSLELEDQKFANKMVGLEMQFWNQLTKDVQRFLRAYLLILFPNIIEGNYNDASKWLLQTQGVINPSFRDTFSAGGRKCLRGIDVPKIIYNIYSWKDDLINIFNEKNLPQQQFDHWGKKVLAISKFSACEKNVLAEIVREIGENITH